MIVGGAVDMPRGFGLAWRHLAGSRRSAKALPTELIGAIPFANEDNIVRAHLQQKLPFFTGITVIYPCGCRELRDLYTQLVDGGVLRPAEFWAGQAALLRAEAGRSAAGQRMGLSSAMLSDVQTSADGRTETVTTTACLGLPPAR